MDDYFTVSRVDSTGLRSNVRKAAKRLERFDQLLEEIRFGNSGTTKSRAVKRRPRSKAGVSENRYSGGESGEGAGPLNQAENLDISS